MGEDEVLAAGLADQARIALVAIDVLGDALPHHAEHVGRAGEVDAGEHRVIEDDVGAAVRQARDEVDDARRHAGFLEQLEHAPGGE
jgi:hypothetical protein